MDFNEIETERVDNNSTQENTQEKINKAKKKIATVKQIEKLEKEVLRLKKNIAIKKAKIEDLAEQL